MAPKNAEVIENPPMGSSSEEEESGSSGEESGSSAEVTKKDESKIESDSEGEFESDSDSEPSKKNKQPVVTSASDVALPESSTGKRPLQQAESESEGSKKLKISATDHVKKPITDVEAKKISGEDAKKMFQRLFSEADEIALLQGILDFTSTKGDPYEESDAFCIYVKKLIDFDASKIQIVTKLQRLKKKFVNTVKKSLKKGKSEGDIKFPKEFDQKAFALSRKIWGENGVLASKTRKKLGGTPKETKTGGATKETKTGGATKETKPGVTPSKVTKLKPHSSPKKQQEATVKPKAKLVDTDLSIAREIASFFNAENASVCGLDETTITAVWEKVADGAEKREMEEKWKTLKAKQVELCLQRTELVNETAKMIFKAYES